MDDPLFLFPPPIPYNYSLRVFLRYRDRIKTDKGLELLNSFRNDPRISVLNTEDVSPAAFESTVEHLAMWFLWCEDLIGREETIKNLDLFLNTKKIEVMLTLWVTGMGVKEAVVLDDEYVIMPLKDMPVSNEKEEYLNDENFLGENRLPRCAITKKCLARKSLIATELEMLEELKNEERVPIVQKINDISLILNAVEGIVCVPYYHTSYEDLKMPYGPFKGNGGGIPTHDVEARHISFLKPENKELVSSLLEKFSILPNPEKNRVRRILSRLSQSKRRLQIEDKILDMTIAMEMILLSDNEKEQLSLSFRLRGSWLLGVSSQDRLEKLNLFKQIYKYRSQVAHTGILCGDDPEKIMAVHSVFPKYMRLAEKLCQTVILKGNPDWGKLILGDNSFFEAAVVPIS